MRRRINLRSDKMAMPVAAAVDMPVAAARSFLFSTRGSVVGNLLNSSVQDWSCFLPSVRPFFRAFVRPTVHLSLCSRRVRCGISFETCAACYSRRAAAAATDGSKGVVITELAVSVSVCALKRSPFLFSRVNQLLPMTTVELRSSASRSSYTRRMAWRCCRYRHSPRQRTTPPPPCAASAGEAAVAAASVFCKHSCTAASSAV